MTWPDLAPLYGIDRAQPYTPEEIPHLPQVVNYYLPSPYASVSWTVEQARMIPPTHYTVPTMVASLALRVGDGTRYAIEAMALLREYPNHGVVALDIEQEAVAAAGPIIPAIDMQEQVAREFIAEMMSSSVLVPIIYGSWQLFTALHMNMWLGSWLLPGMEPFEGDVRYPGITPVHSLAMGAQPIPRPLGWQYMGNVWEALAPGLRAWPTDLDLWSPYLFTQAHKLLGDNVQTYTTEEGDTLASVAAKFYGNEDSVQSLYALNVRQVRAYGTGDLPPGLVLVVPDTEEPSKPDTETTTDSTTEAAASTTQATVGPSAAQPAPVGPLRLPPAGTAGLRPITQVVPEAAQDATQAAAVMPPLASGESLVQRLHDILTEATALLKALEAL